MVSINNTYLAEVFKLFPKMSNHVLLQTYNHIEHEVMPKTPGLKFQKPTKSSTNEVYIGEISSSKARSGYGLLLINSETVYEGQFSNNSIQGQGRLYKPNFIYEGEFKNLSLTKGKIFNYQDNTIYEGIIVDLKPQGKGVMTFKGRWEYKGNFKQGLKDGEGLMVWDNKDRYEGNFSRGKKNGYGVLQTTGGIEYKGEWLMDKMHGKGKLVMKGEYVYDGMFSHGYKQGNGRCEWENGKVYEGFWMKDKYDGFGKEVSESVVSEGIWRKGVFKINQSDSRGALSDQDSPRDRLNTEFGFLDTGLGALRLEKLNTYSEKLNKGLEKSAASEKILNTESVEIKEVKETHFEVENEIKLEEPKDFGVDISEIVEDDEKKDISQSNEDELEEMGPGIKEFVMSRSSFNESQQKSLPENNEKEMVILINNEKIEANESKHSESKNIKSKSDLNQSFISSSLNVSINKDLSISRPGLPEKPTSKTLKLTIKKPQVVPLLEIRAKIHQDPLYQISYQKFKTLNTFEYDPCEVPNTSLSTDWLQYPKEKNYKGFINPQGKPSGNGVLLQRGRIYQGSYLNGKKHGFGRLITPLGRIYEGFWKMGKKHGFGVFTSESEEYCGDWSLNLYHGLGILTNSKGTYDGEFIFGVCEGKAILYFPDNKQFQGDFKNGVPHGFGNLKFGSTMEYDQWKEGVQKTHEIVATKHVMPIFEDNENQFVENKDGLSDVENEEESEVDIPQEID